MTPCRRSPLSHRQLFFCLEIHLPCGPKRTVRGDPVQRPHNSDKWVGWLSLHREEGLSSCTVLYLTRSGRGAMLLSVPGLERRDWWLSREARQSKGTARYAGAPAPAFQAVQGLASSDLSTRTEQCVSPSPLQFVQSFEQKELQWPESRFSLGDGQGKRRGKAFCILARGGLREGSGPMRWRPLVFLFHVFNCGEGE